MIILDSSALIELIHGTEKGKRIQSHIASEESATSVICVHELLAGTRESKIEQMKEFLSTFSNLPVDIEIAHKSAELQRTLECDGNIIGSLDIFIAATALIHNVPLITLDKDIIHVKGLNVILV